MAAAVEAIQMVLVKKESFEGKPEPDAVIWMAYKDHEPGFNYTPGRHMMNDDKSNRYVIDLRYLYYLGNPRKVFSGMEMSISCRLFSERL